MLEKIHGYICVNCNCISINRQLIKTEKKVVFKLYIMNRNFFTMLLPKQKKIL